MGKEAKTNAMRMLDRKKVKYEAIAYDCGEFIDGIHCADITGAPHDQSFKTLVMEGKSGGYYVFVVPIEKEVDRKAAAKSVGRSSFSFLIRCAGEALCAAAMTIRLPLCQSWSTKVILMTAARRKISIFSLALRGMSTAPYQRPAA